MRIVQVITRLDLGGAQLHALRLSECLARAGHDVILACGKGGELDADAARAGSFRIVFLESLRREICFYRDARGFIELSRLFRDVRPDIVHTHSSKAGIVGRLAARHAGVRRIFHTVHGWSFNDYQPAWQMAFYVELERAAAKATTKFFAVCRSDIAKASFHGIAHPSKFALNYLQIGNEFAPSPNPPAQARLRQELGVPLNAPLVLSTSCLKPQKAPLDFVHAAGLVHGKHPDCHFIIAGDGELRPAVEQAMLDNGIKECFHLTGWRRDIRELILACDVFVMTSLWEGLPLAVWEAMACGKPVVAAAVDGVPEAVSHNESGFLTQPGNPSETAALVSRLLRNPRLAGEFGASARKRFEEFHRGLDDSSAVLAEYKRAVESTG
jgi:glycosyltransferase involved in cell wall biosynthesis